MQVIIMVGCSGSGKSTYIKGIVSQSPSAVCSADHFFEMGGKYKFDPARLGEAHAACLRKFTDIVRDGLVQVCFVDNTNTSVAEIAPYAALALAYGHELEIVYLKVDPKVAAARNTHGVPLKSVESMAKRIEGTIAHIPPWWPVTTIEN